MKLLITAGPTREAIDPVRFITNRSSGKMGYAIAEAAVKHGMEVVLISGPTNLRPPEGVEFVPVESTRQMYDAVAGRISGVEAAIFCAAVADYRPVRVADQKIKKTPGSNRLTLELEETEDILGSARDVMGYQGLLVGFAAETQNVAENARSKLARKKCDLIVANDVSQEGMGFDSDRNEVTVYFASGDPQPIGPATKAAIGEKLVEIVASLVQGARA